MAWLRLGLAGAQHAAPLQRLTARIGCATETWGLGDGDFGAEVNVLDGVEELDAFGHGALEGFAAGDEAGAAGALVDDGGGYGFFEVVGSARRRRC